MVHPQLRAVADTRSGVFTSQEALAVGYRGGDIDSVRGTGTSVGLCAPGVIRTAAAPAWRCTAPWAAAGRLHRE